MKKTIINIIINCKQITFCTLKWKKTFLNTWNYSLLYTKQKLFRKSSKLLFSTQITNLLRRKKIYKHFSIRKINKNSLFSITDNFFFKKKEKFSKLNTRKKRDFSQKEINFRSRKNVKNFIKILALKQKLVQILLLTSQKTKFCAKWKIYVNYL